MASNMATKLAAGDDSESTVCHQRAPVLLEVALGGNCSARPFLGVSHDLRIHIFDKNLTIL